MGYAPSTITSICCSPGFEGLLAPYTAKRDLVAVDLAARVHVVASDALAILHRRLLAEGMDMPIDSLRKIAVVLLDRAGYAPVARSRTVEIRASLSVDDVR